MCGALYENSSLNLITIFALSVCVFVYAYLSRVSFYLVHSRPLSPLGQEPEVRS